MATKQELLDFGMVETGFPPTPFKKVISKPGPEYEVAIFVSMLHNKPEFAVETPEGTIFMGGVQSVEDLKVIERCITSYELNF